MRAGSLKRTQSLLSCILTSTSGNALPGTHNTQNIWSLPKNMVSPVEVMLFKWMCFVQRFSYAWHWKNSKPCGTSHIYFVRSRNLHGIKSGFTKHIGCGALYNIASPCLLYLIALFSQEFCAFYSIISLLSTQKNTSSHLNVIHSTPIQFNTECSC